MAIETDAGGGGVDTINATAEVDLASLGIVNSLDVTTDQKNTDSKIRTVNKEPH